jgi:taurine dioxygenase
MQIVPLSSALGAEIRGVDLSQPLEEPLFRRIEQAWFEHLILLFRDQRLDEGEQARFCARFGTLVASYNATRDTAAGQHPAVMYVSNIRENGKLIGSLPDGEMHFHSDQCHTEQPAMATMLYAMEIPSKGGDTLFANMYKAYDTLAPELKSKLEGLKAENVYDYQAESLMRRGSKIREGVQHCAHPVFRTHPVTKRKALYVNRLMTDHIVGLPQRESENILGRLFEHAERADMVYTHRWRVGDVILWDNRCTQHARTDFDASERRKLRRITVRGEKPF